VTENSKEVDKKCVSKNCSKKTLPKFSSKTSPAGPEDCPNAMGYLWRKKYSFKKRIHAREKKTQPWKRK